MENSTFKAHVDFAESVPLRYTTHICLCNCFFFANKVQRTMAQFFAGDERSLYRLIERLKEMRTKFEKSSFFKTHEVNVFLNCIIGLLLSL